MKLKKRIKSLTVVKLYSGLIQFDNGMRLSSDHYQDGNENHFLSFNGLNLSDFEGLKFDLSNDSFFRRIEGYGIELIPVSGSSVKVPGYGRNNGRYSASLDLILSYPDGRGIYSQYDISQCQAIGDY